MVISEGIKLLCYFSAVKFWFTVDFRLILSKPVCCDKALDGSVSSDSSSTVTNTKRLLETIESM